MATHHVMVHQQGCSFRVTPGHLVAGPDDTIVFHRDLSVSAVTILFPPTAPVQGKGKKATDWIVIKLDKKPVSVRVEKGAGRYPYAVYCSDRSGQVRGFAEGGSDPELLIYD